MLTPDQLAELVRKIERGEYTTYLGSSYIEVNGCNGPFGYYGSRYNVCLVTLDREPHLLIYYPDYDPLLEAPPKLQKIYP